MSGHTQGKLLLAVAKDGCGDMALMSETLADDGEPAIIAECFADIRRANELSNAECHANARRIKACWNACEGIPTAELENDASLGAALLNGLGAALLCDELIAALKPFAKFACDEPCECHNCRARALLAKHTKALS